MKRFGFYFLIAAIASFSLAPILWQIVTSLKPEGELTVIPPLLSKEPAFTHYETVLLETSFLKVLSNSFLVAFGTTFLSVLIGSCAAFALAKLDVRRSGLILALVLSVSMFPAIATVSPLYVVVSALGLRDTLLVLVVLYTTFSLPLSIWVLTSFFRNIPDELYFAARIDGCSVFQSFYRVMLPLALPGIAATAILVFIFAWNEFLLALTFTVTTASRTVPVAIALFPGVHQIPWGEIAAASIVVTAPVAALVFLFQKKIVDGLTAGAVKG